MMNMMKLFSDIVVDPLRANFLKQKGDEPLKPILRGPQKIKGTPLFRGLKGLLSKSRNELMLIPKILK